MASVIDRLVQNKSRSNGESEPPIGWEEANGEEKRGKMDAAMGHVPFMPPRSMRWWRSTPPTRSEGERHGP